MDQNKKLKEIDEYTKSLQGKTLEELEAIEKEVVEEADRIDKEVSEKKFNLSKENYAIVANGIRMILEKKTVQWQFTLGMVAMYDFWNPLKFPKAVLYPMLDGTLRALGEASFTGYDEWAAVVAINKYFEGIREEYIKTTERVYDIAAKHNAIIDAMQKLTPIGEVESK